MIVSSHIDPPLACGCSVKGPCSTAAPLFRHSRTRKLWFHLRAAYEHTLLGPRPTKPRHQGKHEASAGGEGHEHAQGKGGGLT